jgi:hypothetical protein
MVTMALNRVWMPSPNFSSRGGSAVRLCVIHTAEGATTIESLGSWFANPEAEVSSHVGIDDKPGVCGEYVRFTDKAWCAANANPYAIQAELCGFAAWSTAEWLGAHGTMLETCAAWIAEECARFGIPVRRINESQAAAGEAGVCGHCDLGYANNDHWDPGPSFPWDHVLAMAAGTDITTLGSEVSEMIASTEDGRGYWCATRDGAVGAFGTAQYKGNALGKVSGQIVGIAGRAQDGYWLLASDGGVFAFGSAPFEGRPDRV